MRKLSAHLFIVADFTNTLELGLIGWLHIINQPSCTSFNIFWTAKENNFIISSRIRFSLVSNGKKKYRMKISNASKRFQIITFV